MNQVVVSQRINCAAAVPSGDLVQLEPQNFHGSHSRLLQIPGPDFQGAAGIISQAHFVFL
jgi:hypothetical protein